MTPKFTHDCDRCKFVGNHKYCGSDCDFYLCDDLLGRTVVARYGNDGPEYCSGTLFICTELTQLDMFALFAGIELTEKERERLLGVLLNSYKAKLKPANYKDLPEVGFMGNKEWFYNG